MAIAAAVSEALQQYGASLNDVVTITTDTAANVKAAGSMMAADWIGCAAHIIELSTKIVMDRYGAVLQQLCQ